MSSFEGEIGNSRPLSVIVDGSIEVMDVLTVSVAAPYRTAEFQPQQLLLLYQDGADEFDFQSSLLNRFQIRQFSCSSSRHLPLVTHSNRLLRQEPRQHDGTEQVSVYQVYFTPSQWAIGRKGRPLSSMGQQNKPSDLGSDRRFLDVFPSAAVRIHLMIQTHRAKRLTIIQWAEYPFCVASPRFPAKPHLL